MVFNAQQLEADLTASRRESLADLLPEQYVLPRYGGRCIANLPPTIGHLLGVERGWVGPPLEQELWAGLGDGVERVVFLLVDGVGWRRLWQVVAQQDAQLLPLLHSWGASIFPITTISPATTSVATTTLWGNGALPAEHGMLGYSFLLGEHSALSNMLFWKPVGRGEGGYGELLKWDIKPETFLPTPSIAQVLAKQRVTTTSIIPQAITKSPLSRMQMREAKIYGYLNDTDLWLNLRFWLKESSGKRAYCYLYYPDFDTFSHRDGPDAMSWVALWHSFRFHWQRLMSDLSAQARKKTLLIVSADHGHVFSPVTKRYLLRDQPALTRHFSLMSGGEPRHSYIYARPGHKEAIRDYYDAHLADHFHLLEAADALQAGLYGSTTRPHPDAERRIGEFVLLSKGGYTLWHQTPKKSLLGMHGSLEPEEMIVPFIAMRLDN